ncbi:hypothetical protein BGZ83_007220 [Gryganskiella cystojenkinii]|nr:hypothetical protein BGZ83_007220 [Gryganskiella cystojenkinii]
MWRSVLLPIVWSDLELLVQGDRLLLDGFSATSTTSTVKKHASFVRQLQIRIDLKSISGLPLVNARAHDRTLLQSFPNLVVLKINLFYGGAKLRRLWDVDRATSSLLSIMLNNNNKRSKNQNKKNDKNNNNNDALPLPARPPLEHLRALEVRNLDFQGPREWMTLYETLWSRLETLTLTGSWWGTRDKNHNELLEIEKMKDLTQRIGPTTLRDLTFETYSDNEDAHKIQAWIIEQSPRLARLKWYFQKRYYQNWNTGPLQLLRGSVQSGKKNSLQELDAVYLPRTEVDPEDFAIFVQEMPQSLKELDLSETDIREEVWTGLKAQPRHLETLVVLNFQNCYRFPGRAVHEMLSSMPSLEVFGADMITDMDMRVTSANAIIANEEEERPWICLRLRELRLSIRSLGRERIQDDRIANRLSTLERLEILDLGHSDLILTLAPGGCLDRLRSLKRLHDVHRKASLGSYEGSALDRDPWGMEEVAWVREYWPELRYLSGFAYKPEVQDVFLTRPEEDRPTINIFPHPPVGLRNYL